MQLTKVDDYLREFLEGVSKKKRTPYKNLDLPKIGKHILWLQTLTDISQYPTKDLALNIKANYYKWRNIKSCPK